MLIVKGNKKQNITKEEMLKKTLQFKSTHIDFGTGDGRYVYKKALKNPDTFYIGVDPSAKQLEIYSKKANKDKLENVLFVVGSIEVFPQEIIGVANSLSVILPWGSLLKQIVNADFESIKKLCSCVKKPGEIEIILGYHKELEPSEVARLELQELNEDYIKQNLIPVFFNLGYTDVSVSQMQKQVLQDFETTWSKKLTFGQDRPIFRIFAKPPITSSPLE